MGFESGGGFVHGAEQSADLRIQGIPLPSGLILDRAEVTAFTVHANGEPESPPPELPRRQPGKTYRVEPLTPLTPPDESPETPPPAEQPEDE